LYHVYKCVVRVCTYNADFPLRSQTMLDVACVQTLVNHQYVIR